MSVTMADVMKLQLDYFYRDPAIVAKAFMLTGSKSILRESKKRGMDLGPHLQREFDEQNRIWKTLKAR